MFFLKIIVWSRKVDTMQMTAYMLGCWLYNTIPVSVLYSFQIFSTKESGHWIKSKSEDDPERPQLQSKFLWYGKWAKVSSYHNTTKWDFNVKNGLVRRRLPISPFAHFHDMTPPAEDEENVLQKSSHLCCHSFACEPAKYKRWPVRESSSHNSLNCLQKSSKTTHTRKNEIRKFSLFFFYSKIFVFFNV